MQINLAAAENMTAKELLLSIQPLNKNYLTTLTPILLLKMEELIEEKERLKLEIENLSYEIRDE